MLSLSDMSDQTLWSGYDWQAPENYGSLLQKIVSFIGLFCKRDLYKRLYFAKETYNFIWRYEVNFSDMLSLSGMSD